MFENFEQLNQLKKIMRHGKVSFVVKTSSYLNGSYSRKPIKDIYTDTVTLYKPWYLFGIVTKNDIITIGHELGHCVSFRSNYKNKENNEAYLALHESKLMTQEQAELIIEEETRAWDFSISILENIGYTDWVFYQKIKKRCIKNYRKSLAKLIKNP